MSKEGEEIVDQADLSADMSDDNNIYAEYQDGRLHIVEVSPYDKGGGPDNQISFETENLPELTNNDDDAEQTKYLQLDLLNFTVLKNADGTNTYKMVSSDGTTEDGDTITCVLAGDDVDDEDNDESYVMLQTDDGEDPYRFLQNAESSEQLTPTPTESKKSEVPASSQSTDKKSKKLTPLQILEKAKAIQRAKALASPYMAKIGRGIKKKKGDLPPPIELLTSPNFKLYLYSCKLCTFKCNAIKEMSAHKKTEHCERGVGGAVRGGVRAVVGGRAGARYQCARCPFKAPSRKHLDTHLLSSHVKKKPAPNHYITTVELDSEEVEAADVLVCGACGFESGDRTLFRKHIEDVHGAVTS